MCIWSMFLNMYVHRMELAVSVSRACFRAILMLKIHHIARRHWSFWMGDRSARARGVAALCGPIILGPSPLSRTWPLCLAFVSGFCLASSAWIWWIFWWSHLLWRLGSLRVRALFGDVRTSGWTDGQCRWWRVLHCSLVVVIFLLCANMLKPLWIVMAPFSMLFWGWSTMDALVGSCWRSWQWWPLHGSLGSFGCPILGASQCLLFWGRLG